MEIKKKSDLDSQGNKKQRNYFPFVHFLEKLIENS